MIYYSIQSFTFHFIFRSVWYTYGQKVPYDYKAISPNTMLLAPSAEHWFGTDSLGRDVFTRTILGGRTALTVTFFGSLIALLWGGLLGIFCGLVGGKIDDVVMRVVDAFLSIPWILAMLLIVSLVPLIVQMCQACFSWYFGTLPSLRCLVWHTLIGHKQQYSPIRQLCILL